MSKPQKWSLVQVVLTLIGAPALILGWRDSAPVAQVSFIILGGQIGSGVFLFVYSSLARSDRNLTRPSLVQTIPFVTGAMAIAALIVFAAVYQRTDQVAPYLLLCVLPPLLAVPASYLWCESITTDSSKESHRHRQTGDRCPSSPRVLRPFRSRVDVGLFVAALLSLVAGIILALALDGSALGVGLIVTGSALELIWGYRILRSAGANPE